MIRNVLLASALALGLVTGVQADVGILQVEEPVGVLVLDDGTGATITEETAYIAYDIPSDLVFEPSWFDNMTAFSEESGDVLAFSDSADEGLDALPSALPAETLTIGSEEMFEAP